MNALTGTELETARAEAQAQYRALRDKVGTLDDGSLDLILRGARSHYAWKDTPVTEDQLRAIYEIAAAGPTSMNTCPGRFVQVVSAEGKEKLVKALKPGNVPKVMGAPVTVIVAYDLNFWTHLPYLFPHEDRRPMFEGKAAHIETTAFRNSTLQGAYYMIAARALGLDVGAMSGFDNAVVDAEFFADTTYKSNFLINLGHADESALFHKLPRFAYDEVCKTV